MKSSSLVAACSLLTFTGIAHAQTTGYRLSGDALLTERFCLPPCLCPYHEEAGPLSGTFFLTRTIIDPQYIHYDLSALTLSALINGQTLDISGSGTYRRGGLPFNLQHQLILDVTIAGEPWHFDSGLVPIDLAHDFPEIDIAALTPTMVCRQDVTQFIAQPDTSVCYANCDGSTAAPILNINDFVCFMARFSAGDPYANCDGSSIPPVLTVNDFVCFQTAFAAGCP
jgi:hypothetical protein